ncbi:phage terminase large subunit [uncultured Ruegeria sp.]|nr:phage terminase large subunit [uncultured Ruegeria sp.]
MGSARFSAQYQQLPVPADGLHVKRPWIKRYSVLPEKTTGDRFVQSWDTASKDGVFSDYSVCVTALLRKRDVYILDVYREKLKFPDLRRKVIELALRWNITALLIEDAASGQQLIQVLRENLPRGLPRPIARKPQGDKQTRFSAQSHRIEAGELWLPEVASWLAEFERELLGFPNLKHDDQVDALTQLLGWSRPNFGRRPYIPGDIPGIMGPGLFIGDQRIA